MKNTKLILTILTIAFSSLGVTADVAVADIFSDNMVLQRNALIPVWGWAGANEKVVVKFNQQAKTVKAIFRAIKKKYPKLELVIAWNQPMLKIDTRYVFGASVTKNYILLAPWSSKVLNKFRPKLSDYKVNKKTFAVPNNWKVDEKLLQQMIKETLAE